jgi:hypothetical protein
MQNDEGNRRDAQSSEPDPDAGPREDGAQTTEPETVSDAGAPGVAPTGAGWPATDVPTTPEAPDETRPWSTEAPAAGEESSGAWPTEAPAAGSSAGDADAWPTTSPEAREEPASPAGQEDRDAPSAPMWESPPTADTGAPEPTRESSPEEWPGEPAAHEPPPSEAEAYAGAAAIPAADAAGAHSVPDSGATLGESTQCPRCGTENRPGLAFCRNCGQRLMAAGVAPTVERPAAPEGTQACPRCGTHNRAGVAFCQNCGASLRVAETGYVPPAVGAGPAAAAAAERRGGAVLGPIVLIVGLIGIVTAYLLPFAYGANSLYERATGSDGYGIAFWNGYPDVTGGLADQAYFGLAAPAPIIGALLLLLAIAGFVRGAPGGLQRIGLLIVLLWSIGVIALFVIVELLGNWDGDVVGLLRVLSPAGIILFLGALIVLIGSLTRLARS